MCKSQIWIIFVILIYGNQSTDKPWRYPRKKIVNQLEEPKLPTAENVTAINKEYLEKAAVEKRKNLLLNYITNEKEKEINLKKNSANSYLIINKINELADWFVKSITEDMDFILDCLTNVQDDLPKGSTLDDQLKNAQEIVDEAAKNWIEDWRDAITELKDNAAQEVIANTFLLEDAIIQLELLVDSSLNRLAQYKENWKEDLVYRRGINPKNTEYGFREFEEVLNNTIKLDLKLKLIQFYSLLFNIINQKDNVANKFDDLYDRAESLLKKVQEFWIRKWETGETSFKEKTTKLRELIPPNLLADDWEPIDEEPEKFLDPYLEIPSYFQTEYRFQVEKLKQLGAAGKTLISAKMVSLGNKKLEAVINPNDQTTTYIQNPIFTKQLQELANYKTNTYIQNPTFQNKLQELANYKTNTFIQNLIFQNKLQELANYTNTEKYYTIIHSLIKSIFEIIDKITIQHIKKLADMWSESQDVNGPFENFHKFYNQVNNEIIRLIEKIDENQLLKSLDDEINLDDFLN
ncbi:uncharacterized protein [Rhodnius prolixus]|uniref:uncharacterized protein n=1 Tax=Rhodnius prolixus TaxID=13249 RepID=UPI003D18FC5D